MLHLAIIPKEEKINKYGRNTKRKLNFGVPNVIIVLVHLFFMGK